MIYLKLVLTMVIWGGTFIAGRVVVQTVPPFAAAFCRFAIASLCLLLLTLQFEGKLPRLNRRQLLAIVLLGMSGVFAYNAFFFLGLQTTPASRAALIIALNPVAIALGSALFNRESLPPLKILGISLSLVGAAVVIAGGNPLDLLTGGINLGDGFLLGCVLSWSTYTLVGKRVMATLSPFAATTYACIVGAIALFIPATFQGLLQQWQSYSPLAWLGLAYLGCLGTALGFNWYYEGLQAIGSARAGIFINLVPVAAVFLAALLLQEPLSPALVLGGSLVILGVYCTNAR